MKKCPKCKQMSAEINHYTGLIVCYNKQCEYKEIDEYGLEPIVTGKKVRQLFRRINTGTDTRSGYTYEYP